MLILGIETTTKTGCFSVLKDQTTLSRIQTKIKLTHSESILTQIQHCLELANVNLNQISLVCVSRGPGSYTGTRVGMATAKGIALGSQIHTLGVSRLKSIAFSFPMKNCKISFFLDAKSNDLFYGKVLKEKGEIKSLKTKLISQKDLQQNLYEDDSLIITDLKDFPSDRTSTQIAHWSSFPPDSPSIGLLGQILFNKNLSGEGMEPTYLRPIHETFKKI